jgi:hypothetical protein
MKPTIKNLKKLLLQFPEFSREQYAQKMGTNINGLSYLLSKHKTTLKKLKIKLGLKKEKSPYKVETKKGITQTKNRFFKSYEEAGTSGGHVAGTRMSLSKEYKKLFNSDLKADLEEKNGIVKNIIPKNSKGVQTLAQAIKKIEANLGNTKSVEVVPNIKRYFDGLNEVRVMQGLAVV